MANAGMSILGGLSGLVLALERLNERNRAEQLQSLQLAQQSGRYTVAPALPSQLRPAGFFQRLAGGTPYQRTVAGYPVTSGGLTLQPVQMANSLPPNVLEALGLAGPEAQQLLANVPIQNVLPAYFRGQQEEAEAGREQQRLQALDIAAGYGTPQGVPATQAAPLPEVTTPQFAPNVLGAAQAAPVAPTTEKQIDPITTRLDFLRSQEIPRARAILERVSQPSIAASKGASTLITTAQNRLNLLIREEESLLKRQETKSSNAYEVAAAYLYGKPFGALEQKEQARVDQVVEAKRLEAEERRGLLAGQAQARAISIAAEKAVAVQKAERDEAKAARESMTLAEARDNLKLEGTDRYVDTSTGDHVLEGEPYLATLKRENAGKIVKLTEKQNDNYIKAQAVVPLLGELRNAVEQIYGPGGIYKQLEKPGLFNRVSAFLKGTGARLTEEDPVLVHAIDTVKSNVDLIRRNVQGIVGTLTEGDAERGLTALDVFTQLPRTKAAAYMNYNTLLNSTNNILRKTIRTPTFRHAELQPLELEEAKTGLEGTSPEDLRKGLKESLAK